MKSFGKAIILCVMLALAGCLCFGCSSSPDSSRYSEESSETRPAEYYEGYWVCSGLSMDGGTLSFNDLTPEDKKIFPYLSMNLDNGQSAVLMMIASDEEGFEPLTAGEWEPTSDGIRIGDAHFVLEGENLVLETEDRAFYFERIVNGSQLDVGTMQFEGISFDAPIELVYSHDAISPDSSRYNFAVSGRPYGPSLEMVATPTEAQDITEMSDFYAGYEDCFTSYEGMNFFVMVDESGQGSEVDFVANGKWYKIFFSSFDEDPIDYTDYAQTFYATIKVDGGEGVGDADGAEPADAIPAGAIPWQEASQHIGESATIYGTVAGAQYASDSNGQPTFINLGAAYPDPSRVTLVIWGENREAFPEAPEVMYAGATVCVTGLVYEYDGAYYVEVTSPSQIQVL